MSLCHQTSGFVTRIDGNTTVELFYSLSGNVPRKTVFLFVHGAGSDHRIWNCQRSFFGKYYPTLAVDLRGYGQSSKPVDSDYSFTMWADDIKAVLDHFQITRVVYFGGNFGAQIGLRFADRYPGIIKKMILAGGNPLTTAATRTPSLNPGPAAWEYAEFTPVELQPIYQLLLAVLNDPTNPQIQAAYTLFLQTVSERIFPDLCKNIQPLRDYVIEVSRNTPVDVTLQQLGFNNPNSWVFEDLFPILDNIKAQNLPIFIVTGSENASFSRGYALTLFLKLMPLGIPAPGTSTPLITQFIGDGNYAYAVKVDKFNRTVVEFLNYDSELSCCDTCKDITRTVCSKKCDKKH